MNSDGEFDKEAWLAEQRDNPLERASSAVFKRIEDGAAEHEGRRWCPDCSAFTTRLTAYPVRAEVPKPTRKVKAVVVDRLNKGRKDEDR